MSARPLPNTDPWYESMRLCNWQQPAQGRVHHHHVLKFARQCKRLWRHPPIMVSHDRNDLCLTTVSLIQDHHTRRYVDSNSPPLFCFAWYLTAALVILDLFRHIQSRQCFKTSDGQESSPTNKILPIFSILKVSKISK